MPNDAQTKTCFIAMPITTQPDQVELYGGDEDHWTHVMESIHVPAVKAAGFKPIRPVTSGTQMIMGEIIKHLSKADMVLCDLSGHNPNVFFELGVRTSLNLPIALVKDEHTKIPFDTSGLNTLQYVSTLHAWHTEDQIAAVRRHIEASSAGADGKNAMWRHFGLSISAEQPEAGASSTDAQIALIFEMVTELQRDQRRAQPATTTEKRAQAMSTQVGRVHALGAALEVFSDARMKAVHKISDNVWEIELKKLDSPGVKMTAERHHQLVTFIREHGFVHRATHETAETLTVDVESPDLDL